MSQRDSGWIQLYAETNQEAADLHVQAFRLAEELSLPVMVCMDGFILTHAFEQVDLPTQEAVDAFLPPLRAPSAARPRRAGDDRRDGRPGGVHRGPLPDARQAAPGARRDPARSPSEFESAFGRPSGGLVRSYRTDDAETVVVALGSVLGTIEDVVDELRDQGAKIGALAIKCFRPWPSQEIRAALWDVDRVIVLEKAFAVGAGGIVGQNVRLALDGSGVKIHDVIAGLGGRPITRRSLRTLFDDVLADRLEPRLLHFLDLKRDVVERELERMRTHARPGPHAENIVRELGIVAARPH